MRTTRDGKVRRTEQEWREILEQFHAGDLSRREFCREQGIGLASLARWEQRLQLQARSTAPFVEIHPTPETKPTPRPTWHAELQLPNGCILRIGG